MKQHLAHVIENRLLWGDAQLLTLLVPELARSMRPGQFTLARDPQTFDPYLRRTLWLYEIRDDCVAFTLDAHDPLAIRAREGDTLDLLAPLGRAIEFDVKAQHILLVGEGARVMPLVAVAHDAVNDGRAVALVFQPGTDTDAIFPTHLLSPEIEYRTDEGLHSELIAWADALLVSGSSDLRRVVAHAIRNVSYRIEPRFARAMLDMPMPCGIGVCYACAVDTSHGIELVCVDGPAMDLVELERGKTR